MNESARDILFDLVGEYYKGKDGRQVYEQICGLTEEQCKLILKIVMAMQGKEDV